MIVTSSGAMAEKDQPPPPPQAVAGAARPRLEANGYLGKHRLAAAITGLNQEIESLEKEMEELDGMDLPSVVCHQVVSYVETIPDGLLPITRGPANAAWDRWFEGCNSSRSHKWWSHK